MLTLEKYAMGRQSLYPAEWTLEIQSNAEDLIKRVNNLLTALAFNEVKVSSGWRPLSVNLRAGGAKRSLHLIGKAVDLADQDKSIKTKILANPHLLLEYGLWMEHPDSTPTWCHLDTGIRDGRLIRVFRP